jgi:pyruvate-ferredoxin/flavodoxin oxidoreductase
VKVLILDTQVYSNHRRPGVQLPVSTGQVSEWRSPGSAQGKEEVRKEIALIAMAHRTTLWGKAAFPIRSLIESFIAV